MKKCNGYLPKSYVFNYKNEIILTYSDLLNTIKDGLYYNFRFCPPEKQIKITNVTVEEISENFKIKVHFVLIDTKGRGLYPKRYTTDFFSAYTKKE